MRRKERKAIKRVLASGHWNTILLGTFGETVRKTPQNCLPETREVGHFTHRFPSPTTEGCTRGHQLPCVLTLSCAGTEKALETLENSENTEKWRDLVNSWGPLCGSCPLQLDCQELFALRCLRRSVSLSQEVFWESTVHNTVVYT